MVFSVKSVYDKFLIEVKLLVNNRIEENVRRLYGWIDEEKRRFISLKDVRLIDIAYRNKDAGLARRGQLALKKIWQDGTETVNGVMNAG